MEGNTMNQGKTAESKQEWKARLAQYLEQQPTATQRSHRWMRILEMVNLFVILGLFIVALYVSVTWKNYDATVIALWWIGFAEAGALLGMLLGLHSVVVKAFPPGMLRGIKPFPANMVTNDKKTFVTGRQAVRWGWLVFGASCVWALICCGFYYYLATANVDTLGTFISVVVNFCLILVLVKIVLKVLQVSTKSR